jgi:hypothetical protein
VTVTGGVETCPTVVLGTDTVTGGISGAGMLVVGKPAGAAWASPTAVKPVARIAVASARRMRRGLIMSAAPLQCRARAHLDDVVRRIVELLAWSCTFIHPSVQTRTAYFSDIVPYPSRTKR